MVGRNRVRLYLPYDSSSCYWSFSLNQRSLTKSQKQHTISFTFLVNVEKKMVIPVIAMANIVGVPSLLLQPPLTNSITFTLNTKIKTQKHKLYLNFSQPNNTTTSFSSSLSLSLRNNVHCSVLACLPPASESSSSSSSTSPSTKLYVSGKW